MITPPAGSVVRARVRWLCRRGMKELDVVLGEFFDSHYDELSATEQAAFVALLDCADPDIWSWVLGESEVDDPVFNSVIARIRRRA